MRLLFLLDELLKVILVVLAGIHDVLFDKLADDAVRLLDDLHHTRVNGCAIDLAVDDEPIDLVQYKAHADFLSPSLADDRVRLRRHAFNYVDEHKTSVGHTQR